jgi:hypothetical protein
MTTATTAPALTLKRSEAINELAAALAKAQSAMRTVGNSSKVKIESAKGKYEYRYATLSDFFDVARKPLGDNGLAVLQPSHALGNEVVVQSLLLHSSGQWIETELRMLARDMSPQSIGSAMTYGRRYAFAALIGMASSDEDDDGAAAQPEGSREQDSSGGREDAQPTTQATAPRVGQAQVVTEILAKIAEAQTREQLDAVATLIGAQSGAVKDEVRPNYIERLKHLEAQKAAA